ncbi:MAG: hypothetical protein OER04_10945 [Cyclobacteriaceae bacterium]|nr:hypothetical protein [Cyclobacteriaceae bacterium]
MEKEKEERAKDSEVFAEQVTMLHEETTRLLDDKRGEKEIPEWKETFRSFEQRIANQGKKVKEKNDEA